MAKQKHSELTAGIFVLGALAAGVGVLIWLGAADVLARRGQQVVFSAPQAEGKLGLETGSQIKVGDCTIGKVKAIRFDVPTGLTLYEGRLERKDIQIRQDARAKAVAEFIGGASIVLETFGSAEQPLSGPGNPVALVQGPSTLIQQGIRAIGYGPVQETQFQKALASVTATAENLQNLTQAFFKDVKTDDEAALLARVKRIVGNIESSSADLLNLAKNLRLETEKSEPGSLLGKVHRVADDVRALSTALRSEADASKGGTLLAKMHDIADYLSLAMSNISGMMKTIRPGVEETVERIRGYTETDVAAILTSLRKSNDTVLESVAKIRDIVVVNSEPVEDTILNLKTMSENLSAAAKEIRRNPWRLLQQPKDKDVRTQNVYDAARAFAEGSSQLDDALARLEGLRQARPGGVSSADPELKKILGHLQATFEKFRLVEDALWKELSK